MDSSASNNKKRKRVTKHQSRRAKPLTVEILFQIFEKLNIAKDVHSGTYKLVLPTLKSADCSAMYFAVTEWQCFRKRIMNHGFEIVDEQQSAWIRVRANLATPDGMTLVFEDGELRRRYSTPCKIKSARERGEIIELPAAPAMTMISHDSQSSHASAGSANAADSEDSLDIDEIASDSSEVASSSGLSSGSASSASSASSTTTLTSATSSAISIHGRSGANAHHHGRSASLSHTHVTALPQLSQFGSLHYPQHSHSVNSGRSASPSPFGANSSSSSSMMILGTSPSSSSSTMPSFSPRLFGSSSVGSQTNAVNTAVSSSPVAQSALFGGNFGGNSASPSFSSSSPSTSSSPFANASNGHMRGSSLNLPSFTSFCAEMMDHESSQPLQTSMMGSSPSANNSSHSSNTNQSTNTAMDVDESQVEGALRTCLPLPLVARELLTSGHYSISNGQFDIHVTMRPSTSPAQASNSFGRQQNVFSRFSASQSQSNKSDIASAAK